MIRSVDVALTDESLSGSWLSTRLGVGTQRLDAMRRAGELLGVRRPGGHDFLYPAWQFAPDGKPLPVIPRLVQAARGAGLSDERLYEVLAARTGISGEERLADALRHGGSETRDERGRRRRPVQAPADRHDPHARLERLRLQCLAHAATVGGRRPPRADVTRHDAA